MTATQIRTALLELGATLAQAENAQYSYDAIIPVIAKQGRVVITVIGTSLFNQAKNKTVSEAIFTATPAQLCEALLRATGKWVEE